MQEDFPKVSKVKIEFGTFMDYANVWDLVSAVIDSQEFDLIPKRISTYQEYISDKSADVRLLDEVKPEGLTQMNALVEEYNQNRDRLVVEKNWDKLKQIAISARQVAQKYTQLEEE